MTSARTLTSIAVATFGVAVVTYAVVCGVPGFMSAQPGAASAPQTPAPVAPQDGRGDADQDPPAQNRFLEGWMEELLYGDRAAARKIYEEVMDKKGLPGFQSELAASRLQESSWRITERDRYRRVLSGMERSTFARTGVREFMLRPLQNIRDEFETALQSDGHGLVELRAKLQAELAQSSLRDPRGLLRNVIPQLRGEQSTSDPELGRLIAEHKLARERGDSASIRSSWNRIQRRYSILRLQTGNRILAGRWATMTRLHMAGQHRVAVRMEKQLRGRSRFSRSRHTSESLLAAINRMDEAKQATEIDRVLANLDRHPAWFGVSAEDKKVLGQLREKLVALVASGSTKEALRLAAQVPYRKPLFREPRSNQGRGGRR